MYPKKTSLKTCKRVLEYLLTADSSYLDKITGKPIKKTY